MNTEHLDRALRASLEDARLSRTERQALAALLAEAPLNRNQLAQVRARAFELVRQRMVEPLAQQLLGWVEDLVKVLVQLEPGATPSRAVAYFSPGEACLRAINGEIARAEQSLDICVFTITDDRITDALLGAHQRGLTLRVITDNDKQHDVGSDVLRLTSAGVAVRVDRSEHHMHHKFALFDGKALLNGSYNWTRSAAAYNEENLIITEDPALVAAFQRQFASIWDGLRA